ncbi:MAG TPA: glycerophosphodiester phosphodiesterase [Thermomicrobiales bacterium]|nr:glycerophosphodiester phosphodiesterase [Thermomicrobiales bacterium]
MRTHPAGWEHVPQPFAVAHRAGNSLAGAADAVAAGADILEADVWLYRGRLEVRHEKTLGPLPILWDRWSLSTGRQRLDLASLLDAVDPEIELLLDLKGYPGSDPAIAARIAQTMDRQRPGRPFLVCSQNWRLLEAFRPFPAALLVHSIGNQRQLTRAWRRLEQDDHEAVSIQVRLLNAEIVRALKQRVATLFTWPINDTGQVQTVLDWGVDGVTTDRLAIVEQVRAIRDRR